MWQTEELVASSAAAIEPQHGVHLDIATYGDISSLFWAHNPPPAAGNVVCDVAFGELFFTLMSVTLFSSIVLRLLR